MAAIDTWKFRVHSARARTSSFISQLTGPGQGGCDGVVASHLKQLSLKLPRTPASIPATLCLAGCGSARYLVAPEAQAQAQLEALRIAILLCSPLLWTKGNALFFLQGRLLEYLEERDHTEG